MSATVYSELKTPGDWLKWETDPHARYCRADVTIYSTGTERTVVSGTVLGVITSGGKYTEQSPDDSPTGTVNAKGILINTTVVPASGDIVAAVLVRGPAVVSADGLTWSADSDLDQAAAEAELEVLGIQVREGV